MAGIVANAVDSTCQIGVIIPERSDEWTVQQSDHMMLEVAVPSARRP